MNKAGFILAVFSQRLIKLVETRIDVYETLCPQQMLVHKGGKIKNWGGECRDVTPTKSLSQNIRVEDVNAKTGFLRCIGYPSFIKDHIKLGSLQILALVQLQNFQNY